MCMQSCTLYACRSTMELVASSGGDRKAEKEVPSRKAALLSQAPVLPFDTDLYEWENPNSIPNEIQ